MKKVLYIATILWLCLLSWSCSQENVNIPKMDTARANDRVKDAYREFIDTASYHPIMISWSEEHPMDNRLSLMSAEMIGSDGKLYRQSFRVSGKYQGALDSPAIINNGSTYPFEQSDWLRPHEIDSELILRHYTAAAQKIPSDKYRYKSVSEYSIAKDPSSGERQYSFRVTITERGSTSRNQDESVTTKYYELSFSGYEDGTVEPVE